MLGCRSLWNGQQTIPLRLTLSPKCSAAILGVTMDLTASKIVIGISPFNISDKFLCQLNIRRKSLRPKKSGSCARKQKSPPEFLRECKSEGRKHKSVMLKIKTCYNNVRLLLGKHENSPCAVKIHPDRVKERNRINKM
jgi:hypothetical protein